MRTIDVCKPAQSICISYRFAKQTADYLFHCLHSDMCLHLLDRSYRYRFSLDFLRRKVNFEWAHT